MKFIFGSRSGIKQGKTTKNGDFFTVRE